MTDTNAQLTDSLRQSRHIPIGVWIRMNAPQIPGFIGYTYIDRQAGFSAKGGQLVEGKLESRNVTIRLEFTDASWSILTDDEINEYGLSIQPSWVEKYYGSQPESGSMWGWWRDLKNLRGHFHPEYPDDLQVLVHDGDVHMTASRPELVWVRIFGGSEDVLQGRVLNQPQHLLSVTQGMDISFVVSDGFEHPIMVTDKYLAERAD